MKDLKIQYLSDYILENKAYQINRDFTIKEKLKIIKEICDLICCDIDNDLETNEAIKTFNTLTTISLELKNIINN